MVSHNGFLSVLEGPKYFTELEKELENFKEVFKGTWKGDFKSLGGGVAK